MAKRPGAGELARHRMAFDKREDVEDGYGNSVAGWQEQFTRSPAMRSRGGSETVIAARLEGRNLMGIYLRSDAKTRTVTTDWRVRDVRAGTEYAVIHVDAVTDPAWVYLDLQSGVAT
jgi:head-tail adaptor